MRSTQDDRTVGLISDYCGLLREAAFVFAMLGEEPMSDRRDVFDALVDVETDSSATYVALVHALADSPQARDSWRDDASRLTASLHATFGALVNSGAKLLGLQTSETATQILSQCGHIENGTQALDASWQESREPAVAEGLLRKVQLDIIALDRSLESRATALLGRAQRRPIAGRTPAPLR